MQRMAKIWWVERAGPGRLGIAACPTGSSLEADLQAYGDAGAQEIVSLLTADEVETLALHKEAETARRLGLKFKRFGIQDHGVPTVDRGLDGFLKAISKQLQSGRSILIHCAGSEGRCGLIVGAVMAMEGVPIDELLKALPSPQRSRAFETPEQEQWLRDFAQQYRPLAAKPQPSSREPEALDRLRAAVVLGVVCILGAAAYLGHAKAKKNRNFRFVL